MTDLYHFAYISKNTFLVGRDEIESQIRTNLEAAHSNNRFKNITGALLYSGENFY